MAEKQAENHREMTISGIKSIKPKSAARDRYRNNNIYNLKTFSLAH